MTLDELLDIIKRSRVSPVLRQRALAQVTALYHPMTTVDVAAELKISKPTVLKWLRSGLLTQSKSSKATGLLFDRDQVMRVKSVFEGVKFEGTVAQRAAVIADLQESLGSLTAPEALNDLRTSLAQAKTGKTTPVSAAELRRGRKLLAARVAQSKSRSTTKRHSR